jgi:pimeloyl-ACP methyl ester carboxylesterase
LPAVSDATGRDVWFETPDGVKLYARDWGPKKSSLTPLFCLPGLTRNHLDFEPVAAVFGKERRVIGLDFRGRGKSSWTDPKTYRPDVEMADSVALLDHLKIGRAALLGSSRGGLVGLLMGNAHRERLAGLMLNDIGPVIEVDSLKRIAEYIGKTAVFGSWDDAAIALEQGSIGFANVSRQQWMAMARRVFVKKDGKPTSNYDPGLGVNFPTVAQLEKGPLPDNWALFDGLGDMPVGVLRGAGSDLLSARTFDEMKMRRSALLSTVVPERGHIPFLDEAASVEGISAWLAKVDGSASQTSPRRKPEPL